MQINSNVHICIYKSEHLSNVYIYMCIQVGVDKSIDGLTTPLSQLKEEVLVSTLKEVGMYTLKWL